MSEANPAPVTAEVSVIPTQPAVEQFMHDDLARSGLTPGEIGAALEASSFGGTVGYRIPYFLPDGTVHPQMYRVRLATPIPGGGKYTQPSKQVFADGVYPYLPPARHAPGIDNARPLLVEGEKKAMAAIKFLRRKAIGFGGCWNLFQTQEDGTHRIHPVALEELRGVIEVDVVLDGDVRTNPDVQRAAGTLRRRLTEAGIKPTFILLPNTAKGKCGLDDWLMDVHAAGVSVTDAYDKLPRTDGLEFIESLVDVWASLELSLRAGGLPHGNLANVVAVLTKHERYAGRLRYDEAMQRLTLLRPDGSVIEGEPSSVISNDLQGPYFGIPHLTPAVVDSAISYLISTRQIYFSSVAEWLESLKWDGKPRLNDFLVRVLHLDPGPLYYKAVSRVFFLGAATRALHPGGKLDYTLLIAGRGGYGKTQFIKALAVRDEWAAELTHDLNSKDARMQLSRGWLVEISEGHALSITHHGAAKAILTDTLDSFRPPYGKAIQQFKRRTAFVVTTNEKVSLDDAAGSGNRRFMPVNVEQHIDLATTRAEIEQVWAEAVVRVRAGEQYWGPFVPGDPSTTIEALATKAVDSATAADPWVDLIAEYVANPVNTRALKRDNLHHGVFVTTRAIRESVLGLDPSQQHRGVAARIDRALKTIGGGWMRHETSQLMNGTPVVQRGYWKPV